MKKLAIIGRILFALPFGLMGLNHFLMKDFFVGMMSSFIPGGAYTILLTGALLILASVFIILNFNLKFVCYVLQPCFLYLMSPIIYRDYIRQTGKSHLLNFLKTPD